MKRSFCVLLLVCGIVSQALLASQVVFLKESPPNSDRSKSVEELMAGYIKEGFGEVCEEELNKQFGVAKSAYEKFLKDSSRRVLYGTRREEDSRDKGVWRYYEYIIVKSPKQNYFLLKSS